MKNGIGKKSTLCILRFANKPGIILGSSFYEKDYFGALKECIFDGLLYLNSRFSSISKYQFDEICDYKYRDHLKLGLDLDYSEKFINLLKNFKGDLNLKINNPDFCIKTLDISTIQQFQGLPLFFSYSKTKDFQQLYSGKNIAENLNLTRLNIPIERVNQCPHLFS